MNVADIKYEAEVQRDDDERRAARRRRRTEWAALLIGAAGLCVGFGGVAVAMMIACSDGLLQPGPQ